jgi:hypothetical protein
MLRPFLTLVPRAAFARRAAILAAAVVLGRGRPR